MVLARTWRSLPCFEHHVALAMPDVPRIAVVPRPDAAGSDGVSEPSLDEIVTVPQVAGTQGGAGPAAVRPAGEAGGVLVIRASDVPAGRGHLPQVDAVGRRLNPARLRVATLECRSLHDASHIMSFGSRGGGHARTPTSADDVRRRLPAAPGRYAAQEVRLVPALQCLGHQMIGGFRQRRQPVGQGRRHGHAARLQHLQRACALRLGPSGRAAVPAQAPQVRVAVGSHAFRGAQRPPHAMQNFRRGLGQLRLVQRPVNLLRGPAREGGTRRRRPQIPALADVDRQAGTERARPARRGPIRHLHPHFGEAPRIVQPQLAAAPRRWCRPLPAPRPAARRRPPRSRRPAAAPAPGAGTGSGRPA